MWHYRCNDSVTGIAGFRRSGLARERLIQHDACSRGRTGRRSCLLVAETDPDPKGLRTGMELAFVLGHPLKLLILIVVIVVAIVIAEQYKSRNGKDSLRTDNRPDQESSG